MNEILLKERELMNYKIFNGSKEDFMNEYFLEEEQIREGLKTLGFNKQSSIMDIGCGDGKFTSFIRNEFKSKIKGIDNDSLKISNCILTYPNVNFELRDFKKDFDYLTSLSYEIILFIRVFGHLKDIEPFIILTYFLNKECIMFFPHFEVLNYKDKSLYFYRTDDDIKNTVLPIFEKYFDVECKNNGFFLIKKKS